MIKKLLEKNINCFNSYLDLLNVGVTNAKYYLLYDSILLLKEQIYDKKHIEYFFNNLHCPCLIKLKELFNNYIGFSLSQSEGLSSDFIWKSVIANKQKTYTITTDSVTGYNFLYFSIPNNKDFIIYNELNMVLFDSTQQGSYEFEYVGIYDKQLVYRKNNMYNSVNRINFYIKLINK